MSDVGAAFEVGDVVLRVAEALEVDRPGVVVDQVLDRSRVVRVEEAHLDAELRGRLPRFPKAPYMTLAPDWVCEVVSPTTGTLDRSRKMPIYAREQVPHLWLVDPLAPTLEVYRLDAGQWVVVGTHGGAAHVHAAPFEGVALDSTRWWIDA